MPLNPESPKVYTQLPAASLDPKHEMPVKPQSPPVCTQLPTASFDPKHGVPTKLQSQQVDTTQLSTASKLEPKNGTTKTGNGNNKKKNLVKSSDQQKSREIKCPACNAVFPTKESMNLHTCNSILDQHISEEGKERKKIFKKKIQQPMLLHHVSLGTKANTMKVTFGCYHHSSVSLFSLHINIVGVSATKEPQC